MSHEDTRSLWQILMGFVCCVSNRGKVGDTGDEKAVLRHFDSSWHSEDTGSASAHSSGDEGYDGSEYRKSDQPEPARKTPELSPESHPKAPKKPSAAGKKSIERVNSIPIKSAKDALFGGYLDKKPHRAYNVWSGWKNKWFSIFESEKILFLGYWSTREECQAGKQPANCIPITQITTVKFDHSETGGLVIKYKGHEEVTMHLRAESHESRLQWRDHLRKVMRFIQSRKK
eukprot:GEMP01042719.1.p1 GENE.GEMP01042719.1~~GEMP01042719.1.p1  ORF type:complete len:230 (+),score=36.86 GEMP01042719.1:146-835(+)